MFERFCRYAIKQIIALTPIKSNDCIDTHQKQLILSCLLKDGLVGFIPPSYIHILLSDSRPVISLDFS